MPAQVTGIEATDLRVNQAALLRDSHYTVQVLSVSSDDLVSDATIVVSATGSWPACGNHSARLLLQLDQDAVLPAEPSSGVAPSNLLHVEWSPGADFLQGCMTTPTP
eukprot:scaffold294979_cov49-Prasinocladus_malaysianus.AAC.1